MPLTGALIALGGAIVGGSMAYLAEHKIRIYELRRDAYLAFFDLRIKGGSPTHNELYIAKSKIDLIGSKEIRKIADEMVLALYPLSQIVEDNNTENLTCVEKAAAMMPDARRKALFEHICDTKLKPAIRKELESWWLFELPSLEEIKKKGWWQFWK